MIQKKDEPEKLSRLKKLLALFKPGSADRLLLRLRGMKQGAEYAGAQAKMNLMNLVGEGGFTSDAEGFTEEEFLQQAALLDSLGLEKAKTDSLLKNEDNPVFIPNSSKPESEEDFDVQQFMMDAITPGVGVGRLTKTVMANAVSGKLGLGKGGTKAAKEILEESDMDLLNTVFGRRTFFNTVRGFKEGLIDRANSSYARAKRFAKLYDKFF
tara:strand:+ start:7441 stop:8073 length:633 start_codon:yes stop_codon:yes gene_type:complete